MQHILETAVKKGFEEIYGVAIESVEFQATKKDFEGDITIVIFAFLRFIKGNPVEIGTKLGEYLKENVKEISGFNVVKGFLNLVITDAYFLSNFNTIYKTSNFGFVLPKATEKSVMVEYSSPNTNKPLHLGHIRNNLLGYSVAEIIKASGKKVYKTQIINDRGIHICKSMLAWQRFGNGETPESTGLKGDKLVGNYYVAFDKAYKEEINQLISEGKTEAEAKKQAPILIEAQQMLRKWEAGDTEVVSLWKKMNQWVYDGFAITYKELGVNFDKNYYESNTYLLGKNVVADGLEKGVFYKKEDGSVWIDLTEEGLDEKIVLRADGTAVYMTQDIGTAIERFKDYDLDELVYTVGNEQDYHFKVLFLILNKLGFDWAKNCYHLSYGMVDLPSGKMKSREGTVVDADDLMLEMTNTAKNISQELGKLEGYSEEEKSKLYKTIGLGALKYYILKVDPKKRILFNPEESVDFAGNTGPFIQYTYARIQSILRKATFNYNATLNEVEVSLHPKERSLIKQLLLFPEIIQLAAKNHSPALIANYTYDLVKEYNSFYQSVPILGCENKNEKILRTQLSSKVATVIKSAFKLLGINVPERM
ncbi:arginine--tRNA ligase [Lutibacter profundi]|uniref:Arginine--tRNA ligase n=1 Tax=Lutibacter profundi TaxID=1622118 RepID=A0A120IE36_9FLAO|nr:arginine--tRNA ligase [Lutibacter profundi]AMC10421.1 arginine--tRNA ligase [Lutibacter profundi]